MNDILNLIFDIISSVNVNSIFFSNFSPILEVFTGAGIGLYFLSQTSRGLNIIRANINHKQKEHKNTLSLKINEIRDKCSKKNIEDDIENLITLGERRNELFLKNQHEKLFDLRYNLLMVGLFSFTLLIVTGFENLFYEFPYKTYFKYYIFNYSLLTILFIIHRLIVVDTDIQEGDKAKNVTVNPKNKPIINESVELSTDITNDIKGLTDESMKPDRTIVNPAKKVHPTKLDGQKFWKEIRNWIFIVFGSFIFTYGFIYFGLSIPVIIAIITLFLTLFFPFIIHSLG